MMHVDYTNHANYFRVTYRDYDIDLNNKEVRGESVFFSACHSLTHHITEQTFIYNINAADPDNHDHNT